MATTAASLRAQGATLAITPEIAHSSVGTYFGPVDDHNAIGAFTRGRVDLGNMRLLGLAVESRLPSSTWRIRVAVHRGEADERAVIASGDSGSGGSTTINSYYATRATMRRATIGVVRALPFPWVHGETEAMVLLSDLRTTSRRSPSKDQSYRDGGASLGVGIGGPQSRWGAPRLTVRGVAVRTHSQLYIDQSSQTYGFSNRRHDWMYQLDVALGWRLTLPST